MSHSHNKMVTQTGTIPVGQGFIKNPNRRFFILNGTDYVQSPMGSYNLATRQKEEERTFPVGDCYPLPQNIFQVQYAKLSYLSSQVLPTAVFLPEHKDTIPLPLDPGSNLSPPRKYFFTQFPGMANWFAAYTPRSLWIANGPNWQLITRTQGNKCILGIAPYGNNAMAVLTQTYQSSSTKLTLERFDIDCKAMTFSLRDVSSRLVPKDTFPRPLRLISGKSEYCFSTPLTVSPTNPNLFLLDYSGQLDQRAYVLRRTSNSLQMAPIACHTQWLPDGSLAYRKLDNPVQITIDADEKKLVMHATSVNLFAVQISSNGNIYALGADNNLDIFRMNSVSVYLDKVHTMLHECILGAPRGVIRIMTEYDKRSGDMAVCMPDLLESKELEIHPHQEITQEFSQKIIKLHLKLREQINAVRNSLHTQGLKLLENRKQLLENFVAKLNAGLPLKQCINALEQNEALLSALGLPKTKEKQDDTHRLLLSS